MAALLVSSAGAERAVSPLGAYARARISADGPRAVANYSAALSGAPDNPNVAYRAYRQAMFAGDFALALRGAQAMERDGAIPAESRLLFYIAALRDRDWREAAVRLAARKQRAAALALLVGETPTMIAARRQIAAGRRLNVAVNTPATGAAFVIARMAGDLITEGAGGSGVLLARLAQFADPRNPRLALIVADALIPDTAAFVDSLGWAAYRRGAFDQAIAVLERAFALDYAQAEIGEHLGDAYWAAGRRIDARYAWSAARVQATAAALPRLLAKIDHGLP